MDSVNSLSSTVENLIKLQSQNTNILKNLSDILNSESNSITFQISDFTNNSVKSVTVPSFASIQKNIDRIDNNIKQLSGLDGSDSSIKLKDGTFRKIIKSKLKTPASQINTVLNPTTFSQRTNWFFENFLNPFLYINLDFTGQISSDSKTVKITKFILKLDTNDKIDFFNNELLGQNISYADFLDLVNTNGISYIIDDDVLDLPPVEFRFFGDFSVLRVFESNETVNVNGVNAIKKNTKFQLDKLTYSDRTSTLLETYQLKKGDSLVVNKNDINTRYIINNVDFETNTISVELIEGYDSVSIGSNILSYYNNEQLTPQVQIGIGYNEYLAVFIKPIDPYSNIPSNTYSPSICFHTNTLVINDNNTLKSLETYYKESVVDFGAVLLSNAKENIPPVSKGIIPNVPVLSKDNFKVVQINKHATDVDSNTSIKKLNAEKNNLKSKLAQLDESLSKLRYEISTKTYKSDIERTSDSNKLTDLINQRNSIESLYTSTVNDIITKANDKTTSAEQAKYRLRGFFEIPESKKSIDGTEQAIIQFLVEYRYKSKSGSSNNIVEFDLVKTDGTTQKAVYSNWTPFKTTLRNRLLDTTTGLYYWEPQSTESSEQVNINQLEIPISPNESVDIRIKSISEAGYPTTPLMSDYSDIMTFDFPDDLGVSQEILSIIKEASNEKIVNQFNNELTQKGVYNHITDQFTQNNKLWVHQALNISSGFLSTERNVISLFDYLKTLEDEIKTLKAQINKSYGVLVVKLEDVNGNQQLIQPNIVTSVFTGNYKDEVSNNNNSKGTIISKTYLLKLENEAATTIQLFASLAGSKFSPSGLLSPIGLINPLEEDLNSSSNTAYKLPFMSRQVCGQYIEVRDSNLLGNSNTFDATDKIITNNATGSTGSYSTDNTYFIYKGDDLTGVQATNIDSVNNIYLHCEFLEQGGLESDIPKLKASSSLLEKYKLPIFKPENRISFTEDDKFLIGEKSCGAYLFLLPIDYALIRVNGNDDVSYKNLEYSQNKGITLQIVFQYRMTDYYGNGNTGKGRIGGKTDASNLEYRKLLPLQIKYDDKLLKFDLEFFARYKSDSLNSNDLPLGTLPNTINRTAGSINSVSPNIQ